MVEHIGRCHPGCTCKRHRKCPEGCTCARHDQETRRIIKEKRLKYIETAERLMCGECGAGPFIGQHGLAVHKHCSPSHGAAKPDFSSAQENEKPG